MQLETYLKRNNITREAFADDAGITRMSVYNIIKKRGNRSMKVIDKIEAATKGQVTYRDLRK